MLTVLPELSRAVTVTVCDWAGPSLVSHDQVQVPLAFFVTAPTEAARVTKSPTSTSPNVPLLLAVLPSFTVTTGFVTASAGASLTEVATTEVMLSAVGGAVPSLTERVKVVVTVWPTDTWLAVGANTSWRMAAVALAAVPL